MSSPHLSALSCCIFNRQSCVYTATRRKSTGTLNLRRCSLDQTKKVKLPKSTERDTATRAPASHTTEGDSNGTGRFGSKPMRARVESEKSHVTATSNHTCCCVARRSAVAAPRHRGLAFESRRAPAPKQNPWESVNPDVNNKEDTMIADGILRALAIVSQQSRSPEREEQRLE